MLFRGSLFRLPLVGAIARSIYSKLADAAFVEDFGASADGVTSAHSSVQAALNSGRKRVFLGEGTYLVNSLRIPSNVTLTGVGKNASFLKVANTTNDSCIENADPTGGNSNITLKDFSIIGNSAGQTDTNESWGIRFEKVTGFRVENVTTSDTKSWGMGCIEGSHGKWIDCEASGVVNTSHSGFLNGASSPTLRFVNDVEFRGCHSANNGQDGFTLEKGSDIRVITCRATGNGQTGIKVARTDNTSVTGCYCENNTNGFKTQGPNQNISFANNIAYRNKDSGFFFANIDTANVSRGLTVTGNAAIENGQAPFSTSYGYALENIAGSTIEDVTITGNSAIDNQVTKTQARGISFGALGTFQHVVMGHNYCRGNTVDMIAGASLVKTTVLKGWNRASVSASSNDLAWPTSIVRLDFITSAAPAANASNVALVAAGSGTGEVLGAGFIRRLMVKGSTAITAGSIGFDVKVNGVNQAAVKVTMNTSAPTFLTAITLPFSVPVADGDSVQVAYTTDATFAPGTITFKAALEIAQA